MLRFRNCNSFLLDAYIFGYVFLSFLCLSQYYIGYLPEAIIGEKDGILILIFMEPNEFRPKDKRIIAMCCLPCNIGKTNGKKSRGKLEVS